MVSAYSRLLAPSRTHGGTVDVVYDSTKLY